MSEQDNNTQFSIDFKTADKKESEQKEKPDNGGEVLEWVCHPAKRNRLVTLAVSIFIVLSVVVVYYATYWPWFAILAFLILTGSLTGFYFPTRYRFTDEDIFIKTVTQTAHKKWSQYRTYYPDKNGVLLSPFVRPSRLENFRGVYIKYWNNRDEVLAYVKEHVRRDRDEDKS